MNVFVERFLIGKGTFKVAVKDSIDVAGHPTKAGCEALNYVNPAINNAVVVDRILQADCQLIGKLNMHELAFGMTGVNHWTGTPVNYHYPKYIPGGSSSGSAVAVANQSVDFSLGTDTGGSIRVPAACCGVYGLKPTFDRVSRMGVMPEESTLDCVGPFARSAEGLIQMMSIIDASFKAVDSVEKVKIGRVSVEADTQINSTINQFLNKTKIDTQLVELPTFKAAFEAGMTVINTETSAAFNQYLSTGKIGEDVALRLQKAGEVCAEKLIEAYEIKQRFTQEVDQLLETVTVLVMPTLPSFPMTLEQAMRGKTDLNISALVRPFNLSGHPALSIPLQESQGRPVGLQVIAAKGQDELLCEVARILSQ